MSSLTPKALLIALEQRDGRRSAWTGNESDTLVPQHRANRGMGGRGSLDRLSNLVWLESDLNGLIESDPEWQQVAVARGIKISGHQDPEDVEVRHAVHGLALLTDDGDVIPVGPAVEVWS
ncbi:hypothetical protein [Curtobacterium sp. MCBD17_028]|uniref:hypothetical protein n=1 Tax=Curtobacterium sp. MCBD17_028 TaxID=2175670 RepID=UPI000DA93903|nr:hypothetical protein [Curtobacterium sp. MCBD17_028]PZE23881.1 hypothetical protein DEI86_13640 [Curtobacterium sp. MCBD17_028]